MSYPKNRSYSQREREATVERQPVEESDGVPPPVTGPDVMASGRARISLIVWLVGFAFLASLLLLDLASAVFKALVHG
jgi:hypothetical protein